MKNYSKINKRSEIITVPKSLAYNISPKLHFNEESLPTGKSYGQTSRPLMPLIILLFFTRSIVSFVSLYKYHMHRFYFVILMIFIGLNFISFPRSLEDFVIGDEKKTQFLYGTSILKFQDKS